MVMEIEFHIWRLFRIEIFSNLIGRTFELVYFSNLYGKKKLAYFYGIFLIFQ